MGYGYSLSLVEANKNASVRGNIGVRLGRKCIKHGISVSEVAKKLGVSRMTVYHWFAGRYTPVDRYAKRVNELLLSLS